MRIIDEALLNRVVDYIASGSVSTSLTWRQASDLLAALRNLRQVEVTQAAPLAEPEAEEVESAP